MGAIECEGGGVTCSLLGLGARSVADSMTENEMTGGERPGGKQPW